MKRFHVHVGVADLAESIRFHSAPTFGEAASPAACCAPAAAAPGRAKSACCA